MYLKVPFLHLLFSPDNIDDLLLYTTESDKLLYADGTALIVLRFKVEDIENNQSSNQTSIAPISPAKPGSVARQPNQCSTAIFVLM